MNKWLLFHASRRYVFSHPLQFFLAILGIAMGVAVVIAIDLASASAEKAFVATTETFSGKVTHKIENSKQKIDELQYSNLKRQFPQLQVAPVIERTVKKFTKEGSAASPEYFRVFGIDPFSESTFRDFSSNQESENNQNSLLSLLITPDSILISQETASKHGLIKDATLAIEVNGVQKQLVVIDIIDTADDGLTTALNDVLIMDISVAQDILETSGFLTRIDISSTDDKLLSQVSASLLPGYHLIKLDNPSNALSQMTAAFRTNLQAMSLLAVMVGMFLIYNTMTFSVVQRRDTFATLRAIGVTHREIFSVVLVEALIIGIIGTLLGLLIGILLGQGLLLLVVRTINDLYFDLNLSQLSISPISLFKGLFLGIIATLVSAWIPLREAFKMSPSENSNRSQLETNKKTLAPKLAIVGGIILIFSVGIIFSITPSLLLSFIILFLVFIGYALMVPMMVIGIVKFIRPLAGKYLGNIAAMSLGNITNSLSRTGVAMTALTLAVATTVGVTTMVGSFRDAVQEWLDDSLKENIYLSLPKNVIDESAGNIQSSMTVLLKSHHAVDDVSIRLWTKIRSELGKKSALVQEIPEHGFDKYRFLGDRHLATFDRYQNEDSIIISEPLANKNTLVVGDNLTLYSDDGEKSFQIIGIYRDYSSDQGVITISRKVYSRYWIDPGISSYGVYLKPDKLPEDIIAEFEDAIRVNQLDEFGPIDIISNDEILEKSLTVFDQTFAITNVLRILTIIVAFIGILSAFMALQLERGKEFATLRVIGLTPKQLRFSMLLETSVMGCIAGVLAIPLGLILSAILIFVINILSFGWSMGISINSMDLLLAVFFSFIAALLAGFHPAYKMSKQAPAKLLRNE